MADSGIEFALKFQDMMSGPLKSIGGSIEAMSKSLTKMDSTLKALDKSQGAAAGSSEQLGQAAGSAGESMLRAVFEGELLAHVTERVASAAWEAGKRLLASSVASLDFGYKAKIAFTSMAGSAEAGNAAFEEAERTARDLAEPVDQVTSSMLGLRSAGIKSDWIRPLVAAAHDLTVVNPGITFQQSALALQEVALQGGLAGRTIEMLRSAGVNLNIVAEHLGAHGLRDLQKRLEAHPLGLYEGLRVVEDVIKQQAGESALGSVSAQASKSISGSIQKIKDDWDILLDSVNDATTGPMADLRNTFADIAQQFDEGGPAANALRSAIGGITTEIDKGLRWLADHPDAIPNALWDIISAGEKVAATVREWAPAVKDFGSDLLGVFETLKNVYGIAEHVTSLLTLGVVSDEKDRWGLGAVGTQHKILPTFDFAPWGRSSTAPVPHMASGGIVTEPTLLVAGDAGPEAIVPLTGSNYSSSRGGDVHAPISVTVHVDGGHASEEIDEQRLAALISEMLPDALISPLEKIAATQGAM